MIPGLQCCLLEMEIFTFFGNFKGEKHWIFVLLAVMDYLILEKPFIKKTASRQNININKITSVDVQQRSVKKAR
jgi:hypothetical protein